MYTERETEGKVRTILASKTLEDGSYKKVLVFIPGNDIEFFKAMLSMCFYDSPNDTLEICYLAARRSGCMVSKIYQDAKMAKPYYEPFVSDKRRFWFAVKALKEYALLAYECHQEKKSIVLSIVECKALLDNISYLQNKIAEAKANNTFEQ